MRRNSSSHNRASSREDAPESGGVRVDGRLAGMRWGAFMPQAEPPRALECADLSALLAGDLSPSNARGASCFPHGTAERGPALATSRQSDPAMRDADESPLSKSLSFAREVSPSSGLPFRRCGH